MDDLAARREHYQKVAELLRQAYGYPEWRQHLPPVDELVSTILSQSTSDHNRDLGFYALKRQFPTWEAVRDAPVEAIEAAIRPAGLAKQKAPRIKNALQFLTDYAGEITLDFIPSMTVAEAKAWFTQMEGIGPKTTAIILLFAFGLPAFPVDTHVHRVSGRLGLIDENTNANKAHDELEAIVPPEDYYAGHLNFIRHGREICQARNPQCERCMVNAHCRYYQANKPGKG